MRITFGQIRCITDFVSLPNTDSNVIPMECRSMVSKLLEMRMHEVMLSNDQLM